MSGIHDEHVIVTVGKNYMEAYIEFVPPKEEGNLISLQGMLDAIEEFGIKYGIDEKYLNQLFLNHGYTNKYTIAQGIPPQQGEKGKIEYLFDTDPKSRNPIVLEDGSVDYKNMKLFEVAYKGQKLAKVIPPTPGVDGMNVLGEVVPGPEGQKAPPLPKGKNTSISEDGTELIADTNGQIVMTDKRVNVHPMLEINEDVSVATGNIAFNGSIRIRGNVRSDYSVRAQGNIEILGFVEGAYIETEGDIVVHKDINGLNKAQIIAKGNISAMVLKDASIVAGGNIDTQAIMHCNIKCNGRITSSGKKGLLVGGEIIARESVTAKVIGSQLGSRTLIHVGLNYALLDQYRRLVDELTPLQARAEDLMLTIRSAPGALEMGRLPQAKRELYIRYIKEYQVVKPQIEELSQKINEIKEMMNVDKSRGKVQVESIIYPGTRVQVGNAAMEIKDDIKMVRFVNEDGRISMKPII